MKRKIISVIFLFLLLPAIALATAGPIFAQPIPVIPTGPWYNPSVDQFAQKVMNSPEAEMFGERYTFAQVAWIINSLYLILCPGCGMDVTKIREMVQSVIGPTSLNPSERTLDKYALFGFPGLAIAGIDAVFTNPPASGTQEISQTLAKFNLASPAYAQGGYGYEAMTSLRLIWSASRNMAYFLMVVLLVAAGFMIMFRVKINPQTAVTLQMMIPKIIISLILVTFSYAIAGLVFDLVYLIVTLVIALFGTAMGGNPAVFSDLPNAIKFFTNSEFKYVWVYFFTPILLLMASGGPLALIGSMVGLGAFIGVLTAVIGIIFIIFFSWTLLKIWWMLVKTYLMLMILIIIGPWQIVTGLLPGQKGFSSWFRNVVAHASVFVVVPLMIFFNAVMWRPRFLSFLTTIFDELLNPLTGLGWAFNPIGTPNAGIGALADLPKLPFMNTSGFVLQFFLGYAILSLTPKVADMVKEALKVPAFKYGSAFGEALTPITSTAGGILTSAGKQLSERPTAGPVSWIINKTGAAAMSATGQGIQNKNL